MKSQQLLQTLLRSAQYIIPLLAVILLWKHLAPLVLLLVIALLLTSILLPAVNWLETRLGGSRLGGVLTVYGIIILAIVGLASFLGPVLVSQAESMGKALTGQGVDGLTESLKASLMSIMPESLKPTIDAKLGDWVANSGQFLKSLISASFRNIPKIQDAAPIGKLIGLVMNLMLVLVFTFILLLESRNFKVGFIRGIPNAYFEMTLNLLDKVHEQVSGYLRGQGIAAASVGVLSTIGLYLVSWIMDVNIPYAFIIGMLAGIANLIPFIGPPIGIITAIIAYVVTPQVAGISAMALLAIVGMFLLVQMIDNFLISPKIMSSNVGMHPLLVMVVIMVGNSIMGPLGMLFAIPAFGVVRATITEIIWGLRAYRIL